MRFPIKRDAARRLPEHLISAALASRQLKLIEIEDDPTPREGLTIYAAHPRHRALGRAGRWLLEDLKRRLAG